MTNENEKLTEEVKELNEEELKTVAGGSGGEASRVIGGYRFSGHVGMYDAVIGKQYYITIDGQNLYADGILANTTEENVEVFGFKVGTKRVHVFNHLYGSNDWGSFLNYQHKTNLGTYTFYGSDVTLYTNRDKI